MADTTIEMEKEIVFLYDPKPRFVSLVKRGANQTPFRVVKHVKEDTMKVLQSIVTLSGADVEAIKAALGPEIAGAVNLSSPLLGGGFAKYEQAPRDAFKADSFDVVALTDDKTILAIQGELAKGVEDGMVAKLFKPAKKQQQYVGMSESDVPVEQTALKSQLSGMLWEELDALSSAVRGIIGQEEGNGQQKLSAVKNVFENFLAALETTMVSLKCDKLDLPEQHKVEKTKWNDAKLDESIPAIAHAPDGESKDAEEPVAFPDMGALVDKASQAAMENLQKPLEELAASVKAVSEEVAKLQKTTATVVKSSADDSVLAVEKSVSDSVFTGCFGSLHSFR